MITVITGMDPFQFDRVVQAIDELVGEKKIAEEVFVQVGAGTYLPKHCTFEKFLSFAAISEKIRASSVVITHAGAGSTLNCIHNGKHPVMIPRLARYDEVVDDHQVPFAERLDRFGFATLVLEMTDLHAAIEKARNKTQTADRSVVNGLVSHLNQFWQSI